MQPPAEHSAPDPEPEVKPRPPEAVDLDAIERDLAGVESALKRLDDGSYWTDETTGEPLPEELLAHDPTARRAP